MPSEAHTAITGAAMGDLPNSCSPSAPAYAHDATPRAPPGPWSLSSFRKMASVVAGLAARNAAVSGGRVVGDIATDTTPASLADAQDAIPGLLNDIVITHVLRAEYFDDPADLARLPAVSRAMRDAMAETGLRFEKLDEYEAADRGCVSAVERMQRGGRLSHQQYLCQAAARGGNLEKLKEFRANRCPWNVMTCAGAAYGGHLEVLQWARANGAPWDWQTCMRAAAGGHLEVLQWARVNGCPWEKYTSHWAAVEGLLDTLKFARANGCRWTASTRDRAADLGYIESDESLSDE